MNYRAIARVTLLSAVFLTLGCSMGHVQTGGGSLASPSEAGLSYNVAAFGAVADGKTLNTSAIQKAIDTCARAGGGVVAFPPGVYLTGGLELRSNIELRLERGAILLGSTNPADYADHTPPPLLPDAVDPAFPEAKPAGEQEGSNRALIYAGGAENVSVTGGGIIDGQGGDPRFGHKGDDPMRPRGLLFIGCRHVAVRDLTLRNSAYWMQHYLGCVGVELRSLHIDNHVNVNNDGIDIESTNVIVSDCDVNSDDDGICLKSAGCWPCQNVAISNCAIASNCNPIKMGTASAAGFRNIAIGNCVIYPPAPSHEQHGKRLNMAGVALEIVDGGSMDGVQIHDLTMADVRAPFFIRLGDRKKFSGKNRPIGTLRNVTIGPISAVARTHVCATISGLPDHPIEGVTLHDIDITCPGGAGPEGATTEPAENPKRYPEYNMFGEPTPAWGLYLRHARGITVRNVRLHAQAADPRPAVFADDVQGFDFADVTTTSPTVANVHPRSIVRFRNVTDALAHALLQLDAIAPTYLRLEGRGCARLHLEAAELPAGMSRLEQSEDVPPDAMLSRPPATAAAPR